MRAWSELGDTISCENVSCLAVSQGFIWGVVRLNLSQSRELYGHVYGELWLRLPATRVLAAGHAHAELRAGHICRARAALPPQLLRECPSLRSLGVTAGCGWRGGVNGRGCGCNGVCVAHHLRARARVANTECSYSASRPDVYVTHRGALT
eukprot:scaffold49942_cov68-Phaeocystis_antarctica.AAC.2